MPVQRIRITIDEEHDEDVIYLESERQVIIPQGMREYYSEEKDSKAYLELKRIVENSALWNERNLTEKLVADGSLQNIAPSFLEVIRKEDDENIFSNLLAYYFEYSHRSFQKFAAKLLDISDMSASFDLFRETKNRVDIWIESEKHIIVIENKIKSGINGISGGDYSQLNDYYEEAKKEAEKSNKTAHYFLFAPVYASFDLAKYGMQDKYKNISYSDIYEFFVEEIETYISDRLFPDFLRGLKRHTLSFPELQLDTMRSRFLRKISLLQH